MEPPSKYRKQRRIGYTEERKVCMGRRGIELLKV
jgi:hypothetical protein